MDALSLSQAKKTSRIANREIHDHIPCQHFLSLHREKHSPTTNLSREFESLFFGIKGQDFQNAFAIKPRPYAPFSLCQLQKELRQKKTGQLRDSEKQEHCVPMPDVQKILGKRAGLVADKWRHDILVQDSRFQQLTMDYQMNAPRRSNQKQNNSNESSYRVLLTFVPLTCRGNCLADSKLHKNPATMQRLNPLHGRHVHESMPHPNSCRNLSCTFSGV